MAGVRGIGGYRGLGVGRLGIDGRGGYETILPRPSGCCPACAGCGSTLILGRLSVGDGDCQARLRNYRADPRGGRLPGKFRRRCQCFRRASLSSLKPFCMSVITRSGFRCRLPDAEYNPIAIRSHGQAHKLISDNHTNMFVWLTSRYRCTRDIV